MNTLTTHEIFESRFKMEPGSPEWERAWQELARRRGKPLAELRGWQYMGPDATFTKYLFRLRAGVGDNNSGANQWEEITPHSSSWGKPIGELKEEYASCEDCRFVAGWIEHDGEPGKPATGSIHHMQHVRLCPKHAAAGDLLEAAKELVNQLATLREECRHASPPMKAERRNMVSAALVAADKAIAKATEAVQA